MVVDDDDSKSSLSKRVFVLDDHPELGVKRGLVSAPSKEEHKRTRDFKRDRDLDQEKSKRGQDWWKKEIKPGVDWDSSMEEVKRDKELEDKLEMMEVVV